MTILLLCLFLYEYYTIIYITDMITVMISYIYLDRRQCSIWRLGALVGHRSDYQKLSK